MLGRRDLTSDAWARELALQRERRRLHRDKAAHAAEERARYQRNRATAAAKQREYRARKAAESQPLPVQPLQPLPPLIDAPCGHPWYDEARAALRPYERHELGSDMDSIARDMLQEWALARAEGREPLVAIAETRRRYAKDRNTLIHGLTLVDGLDR